jgi:hypothetical protein
VGVGGSLGVLKGSGGEKSEKFAVASDRARG